MLKASKWQGFLGFEKDNIRHFLEQRFEKNDENFPTFHDIMDALMQAADISKSKKNLKQTRNVLMEKKMCKEFDIKRKLCFENSTLPFRFLC